MSKRTLIKDLRARVVYDSRGVATIEVDVLTNQAMGRNAAPFGAPGSRGVYEASAYGSVGLQGVLEVVEKEIVPGLRGMDAADIDACDRAVKEIDGSENFSRIGGNTSSAISIAVAKAASASVGAWLYEFLSETSPSLPFPLGNIIGGGAHSMGPAPDMQEHIAIPIGAPTIGLAVKANIMVHEATGRLLEKLDRNFAGGTDDECAWTANLNDYQALEILTEACAAVTKDTGVAYKLGLDVAADRLWDPKRMVYVYAREDAVRTTEEQIAYMEKLVRTFNLYYVEDAFHSDDFAGFAQLNERVGSNCCVCGDDLLATDKSRTGEGVRQGSVNSMIIKINQIGNISAARETNRFAQSKGLDTVISHRSGETEDNTIAHLAVAWNCVGIKTGVIGGERLAKLNEFLRIAEKLGGQAVMATPRIKTN